ncbi:hypothetical protein [Paenibacillus sp.]|uniref:hypothetical protein n=1 Tax=Paenibacillus sp. TaxID=58172 RepID=UPI002D515A5F|nr:hypothetical protein [Paenibacillus sp.]HZG83830.1 hypothetical protein [Paenibacillus sp.]
MLTYLGAYWQRVKRLDPLKKILQMMKPKQTQADMLEEIKRLNAVFGGKVVYRERGE